MRTWVDLIRERIELAATSERNTRDYNMRMPEWGPNSASYAHRDGIARGLDRALEIIAEVTGEQTESEEAPGRRQVGSSCLSGGRVG